MGFFEKNPSILQELRKKDKKYHIGLKLKSLRINKNIALEEIASLLNLNVNDVIDLEHGIFDNVSELELKKIKRFLSEKPST